MLVIEVRPVTTIAIYRGRYFQQVGNTTREIPPDLLGRYFIAKLGVQLDSIADNYTFEHFDHAAVKRFLAQEKNRLLIARDDGSVENLQQKLELIRDEKITHGAILLFRNNPQVPFTSIQIHLGRFKDTTGEKSNRFPIPVSVDTPVGIQRQVILIVDTSLASAANPGEKIPVTLTLRNAGQTIADDVTVKIENVSAVVAPKNTELYQLGAIGGREPRSVQLVLLSDKKAKAWLVRIPVPIDYSGIDGVPQSLSTGIYLMMKGKADLGFLSADTNPLRLTENTPFDLTVRIENIVTSEAKQVSASVDLPAEGTKEDFICKIKPSYDAPAIFLLEGAK